MRPKLPAAEALLPYLRRIDATRVYSNWGPLASELEGRLAETFRLPSGAVTSASSGTAALVGAILASAGRATEERPLALIPAFTFVATAAAVEQCGYRPHFVDVDPETWIIDPQRLADHPALDRVGLVVPVAPFGRTVAGAQWNAFRQTTGVPVAIDGAACFDGVVADPGATLGEIPVAMSFHATKCFATGEGGCVACEDAELVRRAAQALNFGFETTRESRSAGINGKMSEYHAAIGLAELDGWSAKHRDLRAVTDSYRRHLQEVGLVDRIVAAPEIGASYALFSCQDAAEVDRVESSLEREAVDYRRWYGRGLHMDAYFRELSRDDLDVTESLALRLLGVPLAPDLADTDIARTVQALDRAVTAQG